MTAFAAERTPEAAAFYDSLRAAADEGRVYWSYDAPAMATRGVKLDATGGAKHADAVPKLYFAELYYVCGTWRTAEEYARGRDNLRSGIQDAYRRFGSVPVFSWHPENPYASRATLNPTNDVYRFPYRYRYASEGYPQEHRYVIREILAGGGFAREWYDARLAEIAAFLRSLADDDGRPIPCGVRLFHECEDDWHWWGRESVSVKDYIEFFRYTVTRLRELTDGGRNLLFVYSPDRYWNHVGEPGKNNYDLLSRYAGDDYVDIFGYDDYTIGEPPSRKYLDAGTNAVEFMEARLEKTISKFRRMSEEAARRGKVCGLVETGLGGKRPDDVATKYLRRALFAEGVKLAFFNSWSGNSFPESEAGRDDFRRLIADERIVKMNLTPETAAVLEQLKALPRSGRVIYSWAFPWDWHRNERDCMLESAVNGEFEKTGFVEQAAGISPILYFEDFYKVAGTYRGQDFYRRHRKLLGDAIRHAYDEWRAIPVIGWHPENPYVPSNMCTKVHGDSGFYAWRYKSNGYPQEHRYVIGEILEGTGGVCGLGRTTRARVPDDRVEPYANPREWFDARIREIADFLETLVDRDGKPIPVIVRLWHECEDDWQWWGAGSVDRDDYIRFFRLTVSELRRLTGGGRNLLFLYSPDKNWETLGEADSKDDFLYRYPGDHFVDVIGYDDYSLGKFKSKGDEKAEKAEMDCEQLSRRLSEQFCETVRKMRLVTAEARRRGKACGLVETGIRNTVADALTNYHLPALTAPGVGFAFVNFWGYSTIPEQRPRAYADWLEFTRDPRLVTRRDGWNLVAGFATTGGTTSVSSALTSPGGTTSVSSAPTSPGGTTSVSSAPASGSAGQRGRDGARPSREWTPPVLAVRLDLRGEKPGYRDLRELMDEMAARGFKRLELLLDEGAFKPERLADLEQNCVRRRKMAFAVNPANSPGGTIYLDYRGATEGLAANLAPELLRLATERLGFVPRKLPVVE